MPRKRCSQEQIIYALRQVEAGAKIGEVSCQLGVADQTYFRWKKQYAGLAQVPQFKKSDDVMTRTCAF